MLKLHVTATHTNAIEDTAKPPASKEFTNLFADVKKEPTDKLTGGGKTMKLVDATKQKKSALVDAQVQQPQLATPEQPTIAQLLVSIAQQAQAGTQAMTNGLTAALPDVTPKVAASQAPLAGATEPKTDGNPDLDPLLEKMVAVKPEIMQAAPAEPPLTPLEQAVMDLLSQKDESKDSSAQADAPAAPTQQVSVPAGVHLPDAPPVEQAAPVARVHEQPQELVSQNHAHLVFDDPNGRIVMTIAVRGDNVAVTMRSSDDGTTAALARNAGALEDQMRARGLQLADFSSQRDLAREQSSDKPKYEREPVVKNADGKRFTLEEHS